MFKLLLLAALAEVVIASYDRRLLEAAKYEGFATLGGSLQ